MVPSAVKAKLAWRRSWTSKHVAQPPEIAATEDATDICWYAVRKAAMYLAFDEAGR